MHRAPPTEAGCGHIRGQQFEVGKWIPNRGRAQRRPGFSLRPAFFRAVPHVHRRRLRGKKLFIALPMAIGIGAGWVPRGGLDLSLQFSRLRRPPGYGGEVRAFPEQFLFFCGHRPRRVFDLRSMKRVVMSRRPPGSRLPPASKSPQFTRGLGATRRGEMPPPIFRTDIDGALRVGFQNGRARCPPPIFRTVPHAPRGT